MKKRLAWPLVGFVIFWGHVATAEEVLPSVPKELASESAELVDPPAVKAVQQVPEHVAEAEAQTKAVLAEEAAMDKNILEAEKQAAALLEQKAAELEAPKAHEVTIPNHAQIRLIDREGITVGTADLEQGGKGVLINIAVGSLPAGAHGLHFHAVGKCEPSESFGTAGGHLGYDKAQEYGFLSDGGPHAGSLPNLMVAADGTARVEFYNDRISLAGGIGTHALLDVDGAALIIHAEPDDYRSQPEEKAGDRIACGVVEFTEPTKPTKSAPDSEGAGAKEPEASRKTEEMPVKDAPEAVESANE